MSPTDVVIIGAPRSGTNMLRDILTSRPGVVTWPCDEINGIWRHGSLDYPSDEIPVDRADANQRRFVRARFDRVRRQQDGEIVVEKTCANSLRVGYIAALLPSAKFVLITRDGIDATASAMARWHAPIDWRYTARKARYVPVGDLARTAARFARDRLSKAAARGSRTGTWGPRFDGIDEMVLSRTLDEVCAAQWQRCVELSHTAVDQLPIAQVHRMAYEDFVTRPAEGLVGLLRIPRAPSTGDRVGCGTTCPRRASARAGPHSTPCSSSASSACCRRLWSG